MSKYDWFYQSKEWQACRQSFISNHKNGLCERCYKNGEYVAGEIVHHKVWLNDKNINNPEISLNHDNLEYLCQDCHNKVHHSTELGESRVWFDDNGAPHKKN